MKIGLALSGGGIRGVAHAGVLKAFEDSDIKVDIIGGTSSGSMVAVLYAMGYSPYYIYLLFKRNAEKIAKTNITPFFRSFNKIGNNKNTVTGMKSGIEIEELYDVLAKKKNINNVNQIKIPIVIPSVELIQRKEFIFTNNIPNEKSDKNIEYIDNISIGKMIRASSSFPAVFSPCNFNEYIFMDGGILDNVPVNEVKKQGADVTISVTFEAEKIDTESGFMDLAMKTIDIMGNKISEDNLKESDLNLEIYTDKVGLLDTKKLDKCFEYGYLCTMNKMNEIKNIIKQKN